MSGETTIKVVIAKPGLDGHDRGAKLLVRVLRESGMEVTYTGLRQTPESVVETAARVGADVVGISSLSGAHNEFFPEVVRLLRARGLGHVLVIGGGIIPAEDIPGLKAAGVAEVFGPGTPTTEIVEYIREHVQKQKRPSRWDFDRPGRDHVQARAANAAAQKP